MPGVLLQRNLDAITPGSSISLAGFDDCASGLKFNVRSAWHSEYVGNIAALFCQALVVLKAQQNICGFAAIRDEYGTVLRRPFGTAHTLVEFTA